MPGGAEHQGQLQLVARGRGGVVLVLRAGDDLRLLGGRALQQLLQQLQVVAGQRRGGGALGRSPAAGGGAGWSAG